MTGETSLTKRRASLGAALAASALPRRAGAQQRDWSGRAPVRCPQTDVSTRAFTRPRESCRLMGMRERLKSKPGPRPRQRAEA